MNRTPAFRLRMHLVILAFLLSGCVVVWAQNPEDLERLKIEILRLWDQAKWPEAMPLAEQLAVETTRRYGENNTNSADALHYWAYMVQQNGDYDLAEQIWRRALAIDEALFGKDAVETTRRLHMLAGLYRDRGDYRKSAPLLHKILAIRERDYGTNDPETAQVVRSLGQVYAHQGNFARAEAALLRALHIYEDGGKYNRKNVSGTLSALGWLYVDVGDKDKAAEMWQRALEIRQEIHGREHEATAYSLRELALIHRARGQIEKANTLLVESLAICERLLGTNHFSLPELLNALADNHIARGDLSQAEAFARRAQSVIENHLGEEHRELAGTLMILSRIKERQGDYIQARKLCQRAYELREGAFGISHRFTLGALRRLAYIDLALGQPQRAIALSDQLQDGEEALLASILSFTSERQRLALQQNSRLFRERYDLWAGLGAVGPLARAVLRTKGLVLDSLVEDRLLADASDDPQIRDIVREGTQARRQMDRLLALATTKGRSSKASAEVRALAGRIETLEGSLARHIAGLGHARRALSVTAGQVQSVLPEETVLLEFVRYQHYGGPGRREDKYGTLIFTPKREPQWVCLGSADSIEKSIRLYQHAVRSPGANEALVDSLRELHRQVWAPVAESLPERTSKIIVSPDSELNFVSFAALLTSSNRFLGEDYLFSYVSSGRDLLVEEESRTATSQLLIWANPDFDATPRALAMSDALPVSNSRGLNFRPLPGSEKEGNRLRDRARKLGFGGAVLYLGTNATEAELRRVRSPQALHLATHGFVLPQIETLLAAEELDFAAANRIALSKPNAMLRSGIALAGAQHSLQARAHSEEIPPENDGIVTADEISDLNFRGTSLVVLSACDTGAGEALAGEGVLGLRRGFVRAGARNLLLTLWPIEDESAAGFVSDFYAAAWATGHSARALAQVQRTWLGKLRREKGVAEACQIAGPFILSFQGRPE